DAAGHLHLVAADAEGRVTPVAANQLESTLLELCVDRPAGRRWVASHLKAGQWCIAPVRNQPPLPPPTVVERRGRERMTLELAGVCIGLLSSPENALSSPRLSTDLLRENQARYALLAEQVPAVLRAFSDRKSTRLNSSHVAISYAVFCLKKKKTGRSSHPLLV